MKIRNLEIPLLPLSAILFFTVAYLLTNIGVFPSTQELGNLLERLYDNFGFIGLFIAAFLEGVVYVGLYFAGSLIMIFVVLFSDGSLVGLLTISTVVALALTLSSIVNYVLGRHIVGRSREKIEEITKEKRISRGFLLSTLHPNSMAFYFFNLGLKKKEPWQIVFVPLIIIPYGLVLAFITFKLKSVLTEGTSGPIVLFSVLLLWFFIDLVLKNKNEKI